MWQRRAERTCFIRITYLPGKINDSRRNTAERRCIMNQTMYDLCKWAIDAALKNGATDCRARMSRRRFVEIRYRDHKAEVVKEATTRGLNLNIYMNGKFSSQIGRASCRER